MTRGQRRAVALGLGILALLLARALLARGLATTDPIVGLLMQRSVSQLLGVLLLLLLQLLTVVLVPGLVLAALFSWLRRWLPGSKR